MTNTTHLKTSVFSFLKKLEKNNNREWFTENKAEYIAANSDFKTLAESINEGLHEQDNIERMKLFRIYRDVRFSKNKTPYKINFSGSFTRATEALRGGYYFHVQPDNQSFMAAGFWQPEAADLKRIREEIAADAAPLRKIINSKSFKEHFGELGGEQLKSNPRGYAKDHQNIDLLRYKSFVVSKHFTDAEVQAPGFANEILKYFKATRPFFDYMSDVLTTDVNGVSLI